MYSSQGGLNYWSMDLDAAHLPAEVGKVNLKSNGDEALNNGFLLKSNGDKALNDGFP